MTRTPTEKHVTRYRCTTHDRGHIYDVITPNGAILGDGFTYFQAKQRALDLTMQMSGLFDDPLPGAGVFDLTVRAIGTLSDEEGRDQYVIVSNRAGSLTADQAREWMLGRVYRDTDTPGGYYCKCVAAVQVEDSDSSVICTIQHRYDI